MAKGTSKAAHAAPAHHGPDDHDDHGGGGHDDHGGGGHCPPPWIITFADMATLLMAFFVIMLMTANTDTPKFNAFASTMRQTFGTPTSDSMNGGKSILELKYGPQSGEQTDDPPSTTPQSGDPTSPQADQAEGIDNPGGGTMQGNKEAAELLAKAMQEAMAKGAVTIESDEGSVTVRLPAGSGAKEAQEIAEAIAKAAGQQPSAAGDVAAAAAQAQATAGGATDPAAGAGTGGAVGTTGNSGAGSGTGAIRAKMAATQAGMLLDEQMADGAVTVEQRDGAVVVTVGAGGAFSSGSADLTEEAQKIIAELEKISRKATRIVVTGHTDNVPLSGGIYRDNWELASARAASVVRAIEESGVVPDAELVATSKGEAEPIADNTTEEGRAKNRRIEIEIEFEEE